MSRDTYSGKAVGAALRKARREEEAADEAPEDKHDTVDFAKLWNTTPIRQTKRPVVESSRELVVKPVQVDADPGKKRMSKAERRKAKQIGKSATTSTVANPAPASDSEMIQQDNDQKPEPSVKRKSIKGKKRKKRSGDCNGVKPRKKLKKQTVDCQA
mmetsp:Transcript_45074/g.79977  ORF Transcript_45074/g.79977 Transcript_45074/m.79977 type:complete len:157 (+) Transcript_45074:7-477(+)